MKIFDSQFIYDETVFPIEWHEVDDFSEIPQKKVSQIYGVCLYKNKVVLVSSGDENYNLPGGKLKKNETYDEALRREIKEETNMKVISWKPIGFQIVTLSNGTKTWQLRAMAKVEKIGDFIKDPDGPVTKNKLCELNDLNSYIKYGRVGERLIKRALELKNNI
jgi:hypothetical protein